MKELAFAELFAGVAIVVVHAVLRRLGRDPLGPRPSGELPDTGLALFAAVVGWALALFLVVGAFQGSAGIGGLSGPTVTALAFTVTNVLVALALLRKALSGTL